MNGDGLLMSSSLSLSKRQMNDDGTEIKSKKEKS